MLDKVKHKKIFEAISQASNTISKLALDEIPGGSVLKAIWDFGPELRMNRSLEFLYSFQQALENHLGRNFYEHEIKNEDFSDLFFVVMSKVQTTKSQLKKTGFRNILLKQVINPVEGQLAIKYAQILDSLNESQFYILCDFRDWDGKHKITSIIVAYMGNDGLKLKDEHSVDGLSKRVGTEVTKAEVEYYMNELVTMGLIHNSAKVITAMGSGSPQNDYRISSIGKSFLKHIEQ